MDSKENSSSKSQKLQIKQEFIQSEATHYHQLLHPNQHATQKKSDEHHHKKSCIDLFNYYDDKYIRPIFVYKYSKVKKRMNFEFEDVLKEY